MDSAPTPFRLTDRAAARIAEIFASQGEGALRVAVLAGAELDYTDALMGSHFAVRNPNATSSCGCGTSFSVD